MNIKRHYFLLNMDPKNVDLEMVHDKFKSHTLKYHISKHHLFSYIRIFFNIFLNKSQL